MRLPLDDWADETWGREGGREGRPTRSVAERAGLAAAARADVLPETCDVR